MRPATASAKSCPVTRYGYTGYYLCGISTVADNPWFATPWAKETFVIGTDRAMWHIWPGSGGWQSMGGYFTPEEGSDPGQEPQPGYTRSGHRSVDATAYGHVWCKWLGRSGWSSWIQDPWNCP
ncbi:hypothetical protein ABZ746_24535 [Streptomyces sp. NPDC020096]